MRKKQPPKSRARKIMGGIGYSVFLLVALAGGSVAGWLGQSTHLGGIIFNTKSPQDVFHNDTLTVLILGCDEDLAPGGKKVYKKQARSDMMLIARLDFKNKSITGVSVPRDTESRLKEHRDLIVSDYRGQKTWKINAYHEIAEKGHEAELTEDAVEELLPGVHIDRVMTLDFDAFQEVVNTVGGVPITVDKPLDYVDKAGGLFIHLKQGPQILNGYDSMCYVRFRHGDDDLQRQARQKNFLLAFKSRALSEVSKLPKVIDEGVKVLGGAFNDEEIGSLVRFARTVPPANIDWGQVPVLPKEGSTNLLLDKKNLEPVLEHYKLAPPTGARLAGTHGTQQ